MGSGMWSAFTLENIWVEIPKLYVFIDKKFEYEKKSGEKLQFGFNIHIKRVPNYYVYVIALPCFILTTLSIIGMFWTPNIKKEQLVKVCNLIFFEFR